MKRVDDTGFAGLKIVQNPKMFCYGVDAVILAGAALEEATKAERICDLGTGNGIVPLILGKCTKASCVLGIDLLEENSELGTESAKLNHMDDRVGFLRKDVRDIRDMDEGSFDLVTMNPPYVKQGSGILSGDRPKDVARHEVEGTLEDFMKAAEYLLKPGGYLVVIQRQGRLADLIEISRALKLEPKTLRVISGKVKEKPVLVLMKFQKGGGENLEILEPWAIRNEDGEYTPELLGVYEDIKQKAINNHNNGGAK